MWIVIKYKKKEINLLKNEFKKKIDQSVIFYIPKMRVRKFIGNKFVLLEKEILEDYAFCYHKQFSEKSILKSINSFKGLKQLMNFCSFCQKEIIGFINLCRINTNEDGFVKTSIFDFSILKNGTFSSGPFVDIVFKVLKNQKNKLRIIIGNIKAVVNKEENYFFN